MGIADRNFEKALSSSEAAMVRGKLGVEKGNKYIQEIHNELHMPYNERKCGYDIKRD